MEKLDKQSKEELRWFISVGQIRPRILKSLYGINDEALQELINTYS